MLYRIGAAVVVAIAVGLLCLFVGGPILSDALGKVEIAATIGKFLTGWAWVLGILVGAWYFFTEGSPIIPRKGP